MPTQKEFSDEALGLKRRRRAGVATGNRRLSTGLLLLGVVGLSYVAADVIGHRVDHVGQTRTLATSQIAVAPPPLSRPPSSSVGTGATQRPLAVATPVAGTGRFPDLLVTGSGSNMTIHSSSPAPVTVLTSDGFGAPFHHWARFVPNQARPIGLTTGRSYGYCFSQPAAAAYSAVRACGRLVMHQYLNGVRAPDGGTVSVLFTFVTS